MQLEVEADPYLEELGPSPGKRIEKEKARAVRTVPLPRLPRRGGARAKVGRASKIRSRVKVWKKRKLRNARGARSRALCPTSTRVKLAARPVART